MCCKNNIQNESEAFSLMENAENMIEANYHKYHGFYASDDTINAVNLYRKIEEYYMFSGLLLSRDKKSYLTFYDKYIELDTTINLNCLYQFYPKASMLISPANISNNFYSFNETFQKLNDSISIETPLSKIVDALNKMQEDYDIVFDRNKVEKYLESIDDHEFETKIIYRLPIIAFSHLVLSERNQSTIK